MVSMPHRNTGLKQGSHHGHVAPSVTPEVRLRALSFEQEVAPGTDLGVMLGRLLLALHVQIAFDDILVVSQKIVSKAEGRCVSWRDIIPGSLAKSLAERTGKDARVVELVLSEATEVVRAVPGVLIVRHKLGFTMANAGIDLSNSGGEEQAILLPVDPDLSAARIANAIAAELGTRPAVLISDSFGRPWRQGVTNVAIGLSGMPALIDCRGRPDRDGRPLEGTEVAIADAVAAAAGLLMGEAAEDVPAVLVSGLGRFSTTQSATALVRPAETDLFR
jgi:coenzyme F420-0:L-glutamate ligase/coenzyme F420-1:gamma-L-glutamate ligase